MPVEVMGPISRKGSKVGSVTRGESPGARSMPGRSDQSEPSEQPSEQHVHVHMQEQPQQPEERDDSAGLLRRLADRIRGRNQRAGDTRCVNFPRDG
jgi:hypothetical protein